MCDEHGRVASARAPRSSSARAVGVPLPDMRRASSSRSPRREAKPLIPTSVYAISKRDHEELCLVVGAAYGDPDRRAALLQRLRAGAVALEPVHRRRRDLRVAPPQRQRPPVIFEDGRQSRDFIHVSDIVEGISSRSSPTTPRARHQPRHRPAVDGRRRRRGTRARARASRSSRYAPGSTAPATSATASPTPTLRDELLGFEASVTLEDGMARSSSGSRARLRTISSTRRRASSRRAGSPADACRPTSRSSSSRRTRRTGSRRASRPCTSTRGRLGSTSSSSTTNPPTARVSSSSRSSRTRGSSRAGIAVLGTPTTAAFATTRCHVTSSSSTLTPRSSRGLSQDLVDGLAARPTSVLSASARSCRTGSCIPTIRRFSTATRWFFEAIGSERFPFRASWLGERELDMSVYEQDFECDWRQRFVHARPARGPPECGILDERFFSSRDETDLCLRIKQAGWEVRHLPDLTILHHAGKAGWNPKLEAQGAYAKRLYMRKHFSPPHRLAATAALALGYGLRSVAWQSERERRECARAALGTLLGRRPPPLRGATTRRASS